MEKEKNKERIPQLRFPEFKNAPAWEQRKLGKVGITQSGIGFPDAEQGGKEGIPFFKVSDMNIIGNEFEMQSANNYVSKEQIERKNWKPITSVPAIMFAKVGAAIMLNRKRLIRHPFLIDNNTMAYIFDKTWDINFGKIIFDTIYLPKYSQVGALPSYNGSDIENINVFMPNSLPEQKAIGDFFSTLDRSIALHQRELENLKNRKKSLLQKMFPKNGESVPKIRFPEFKNAPAWEQRKLGEVAEFSKGNGYSKSDLIPTGTPIILYGRLYTNYETIIDKVDTYVSPKENSVVSQGNEVIVPASGETAEDISRASVVKNSGVILGGDLNIIKVNDLISTPFLAITISNGRQQKELSKRAQGKSVVHIRNSDLKQVDLMSPSLPEQKAIGDFFSTLDRSIALHQRKLEHLKLRKKALLQKMFP